MRDLLAQERAGTIDAITAGTRRASTGIDATNSIAVAAKNIALKFNNLPNNFTAWQYPYNENARPGPQIQNLREGLSHVPNFAHPHLEIMVIHQVWVTSSWTIYYH